MVKRQEEQINKIFHALSDPTRREILRMLSKETRQASDVAAAFRTSFPAISKHLKVLEKAKLIKRKVSGRVHHFHFEEKTMKKAYHWIQYYEQFWLHNLDNLEAFLVTQESRGKD